jgi:chromosome partitioning protein
MLIYVFANQKGGVGKTATAVSLAAYLAEWGQRVLLVDTDPQANATSSVGVDKRLLEASLYDVIMRRAAAADAMVGAVRQRLDLLPAVPALAGATIELVNQDEREYRLKQALDQLDGAYDYVLIDTPPSLGILTVNALIAAQGVIVPVQCEYLALEGLSQLTRVMELVRRSLNAQLRIRGLVLTMYDARTILSRQVVDEVRRHFPGQVFNTIIPRNVKLSEAPSYGEPIMTYAPHSTGAMGYAALARELLIGDGRAPVITEEQPEPILVQDRDG